MKKLITLLLVLTGMVSTASADWYVAGQTECTNSTTAWQIDEDNKMESIGDGFYRLVVTGKPLSGSSDEYKYKITDGTNWYGWAGHDNDGNAGFTPHITGTYDITYIFNSNTNDVWEASALLTDGPDIYLLSNKSWTTSDTYKFTNTNGIYTKDVEVSDVSELFYFRFAVSGWDNTCGASVANTELNNGIQNEYDIVLTNGDYYGEKNFVLPLATKPLGKISLTLKFINRNLVMSLQGYEKVTMNNKGYSTFVNHYPLNISGATAYYAVDTNNGSATATAFTNPLVGTPMLIKGAINETYYFAVAASGTPLSEGVTNAFKAGDGGTITGGAGPYNYVLNGDAFYLAKSTGTTVVSGKAYLQLSAQAPARALIFPEDNETMGVVAISTVKATEGAYYNLSGQRVSAPTKGLYIQNGKKMIVK